MQAVILAAGLGKRLGELTKNNTKCMVEVNGVTLIDRMLVQLRSINISRVIIVVGYKGEHLKQFIGDRYNDLNIIYVENPIYNTTNNIYSFYLTKEYLEQDDTLLLESDLIFDTSLLETLLNDSRENLALVSKYEAWMDGTVVTLDDNDNIINFVPKKFFQYDDINKYYKTVNIYKFSRTFLTNFYVPFLDAYCKAMGKNEYYEQVLRVITLLDNCELKALRLTSREKWYEIDDIQDLDIASSLFNNDNKYHKYTSRYGGYWRFPSMLDFCYLVNPYFPPQQMVEEIKANFTSLLTQYPSGLRINNLLASKYFNIKQEYTIVGNGAAELIKALMLQQQGTIGITYPTFEEYPNRFPNNNKIVTYNALRYTANDLITFFSERAINTLLLINPDNPSGNMLTYSEIQSLLQWTKKNNIQVIIDESFVDFADNSFTLLNNTILANNPHLVVVKSISKSYGVPGLRLGVLATANDELMQSIRHDVPIWNINSFAEFYMQIFGKYQSTYINACQRFKEERKRFEHELNAIPYLKVIPSQANYFLCEVTNKYHSYELAELLLTRFNILIKDCSKKIGFEGLNMIRIAVRDTADNNRLLSALQVL